MANTASILKEHMSYSCVHWLMRECVYQVVGYTHHYIHIKLCHFECMTWQRYENILEKMLMCVEATY
jgi:hypothetical protein